MNLGNVPLKTEYYTPAQNAELIGMIKAAIRILTEEDSIESQRPLLPNFAYQSPKAGGPPLFSYSLNGVNDIGFRRAYGKEAWETSSVLTGVGKSSQIRRAVPKIEKEAFDFLSLTFRGIDKEPKDVQGIKTLGFRFNYTSPKTGKRVDLVFYEPAYLHEKDSTYPSHFLSADLKAQ
ncbi:MAG: hypothetical protein CVU34_18850 [Betaproteobacteria bacterium HGW-Betaproteobacteria-7]|jgi:hypothetical protein|nr:MAG: hypothetical protein CVU34_18850 [Betaproteobacteria bacterium HGW-Betaproteobacteria-7]